MFTIRELIDLVIMTIAIGYIFSTFIKREPMQGYDPIKYYQRNNLIEDIKYGAMIAAPAIILHELAHKFVAMGFGAVAILRAPIGWYIAVVIMRMLNFPLIFFVGGEVLHTPLPPLESALVSISGPLINFLLYLAAIAIIKYNLVNRKYFKIIQISGKLNMFLAIFNMIPLPGFDGFNFFANVVRIF
jgi:Zn-dependent protease